MDHLAEGFRGAVLARAAMPGRSAASRSFLEEELGANGSFAGRPHRGVLAEDFERTRVNLRGHDEGLLAHVGPDISVVQSEREVDAGFVAYLSRRTAMSSSVRPRPDCSLASSMSMSHLRIRSLAGSLRARSSLRTSPDRVTGGLAESAVCTFREN